MYNMFIHLRGNNISAMTVDNARIQQLSIFWHLTLANGINRVSFDDNPHCQSSDVSAFATKNFVPADRSADEHHAAATAYRCGQNDLNRLHDDFVILFRRLGVRNPIAFCASRPSRKHYSFRAYVIPCRMINICLRRDIIMLNVIPTHCRSECSATPKRCRRGTDIFRRCS